MGTLQEYSYIGGYLYIQDSNNTKYYLSFNSQSRYSEFRLSDNQKVILGYISLTTEKREVMYIYFDNTSKERNKYTFVSSTNKVKIFASGARNTLTFLRDMKTYRNLYYNEFDLS